MNIFHLAMVRHSKERTITFLRTLASGDGDEIVLELASCDDAGELDGAASKVNATYRSAAKRKNFEEKKRQIKKLKHWISKESTDRQKFAT